MRRIFAAILAVILMMSVSVLSAYAASGVPEIKAYVNSASITADGTEKEIVLTVSAEPAFDAVCGFNFTIDLPAGFSIKNIEGGEACIEKQDMDNNLSANIVMWTQAEVDNVSVSDLAKVTITVPANIPDGDYPIVVKDAVSSYFDPEEGIVEIWQTGNTNITGTTVLSVSGNGEGSNTHAYPIVINNIGNGVVSTDTEEAFPGQQVKLFVSPVYGFELVSMIVTDVSGNVIELAEDENGDRFSFAMPESDVVVSALFTDNVPDNSEDPKTDTGENNGQNGFVDVNTGDYYYDAVLWAAANGITTGTDATHFGPNGITTRAQMVTFLWRAAGCPEPEAAGCDFYDVVPGSYYEKAVLWAVEKGITKGTSATAFSPDNNVTRGQAVTFLARLNGINDSDAGYTHGFTDVQESDYYNNAVAWAATNGITSGTTATTFSPNNNCLRAQIVTFLYRCFVK